MNLRRVEDPRVISDDALTPDRAVALNEYAWTDCRAGVYDAVSPRAYTRGDRGIQSIQSRFAFSDVLAGTKTDY